jgi:hypothetical protein
VDIDINYIGALDREEMLAERPKIEQAAQAVFSREGFTTKRVPDEHAGGKWRLGYQSYTGQSGNLEVDLNFMFRQPLWDVQSIDSHPLGDFQACGIPVLDIARTGCRQTCRPACHAVRQGICFDCHRILNMDEIERDRLRVAFVVMADEPKRLEDRFNRRRGFQCCGIDEATPSHFKHPHKQRSTARQRITETRLVRECRDGLALVLPFSDAEREFLDLLLDRGKIDATILTSDAALQKRIQGQPLLKWKAAQCATA